MNEEEAEVVRMIFEWYIHGDDTGQPLAVTAIAARLTERRILTRGDVARPGGFRRKYPPGVWSESVVNTILRYIRDLLPLLWQRNARHMSY